LGGVLVAGRFVGEGLDELVGEDLNVGSAVAFEVAGGLLGLVFGGDGGGGVVVGVVVFLGYDDGGVGVAPEDTFVPHEVVIDEFAGLRVGYI
jgi:hypothetical protein